MIHIWYGIAIVAALAVGMLVGFKKPYNLPSTKVFIIGGVVLVSSVIGVAIYFWIMAQ